MGADPYRHSEVKVEEYQPLKWRRLKKLKSQIEASIPNLPSGLEWEMLIRGNALTLALVLLGAGVGVFLFICFANLAGV